VAGREERMFDSSLDENSEETVTLGIRSALRCGINGEKSKEGANRGGGEDIHPSSERRKRAAHHPARRKRDWVEPHKEKDSLQYPYLGEKKKGVCLL